MRGATRVIERGKFVGAISIHTPHAGRDGVLGARADKSPDFNPHAPCGARPTQQYYGQYELGFQSTRPMRGATLPRSRGKGQILFQSTRPMRGATSPCAALLLRLEFQSTRPMRGATKRRNPADSRSDISIHTPHAGRDQHEQTGREPDQYFNPHAPCGARPECNSPERPTCLFQSTRPMRGATAKVYKITLHTFATKGNS